VLQVGEDAFAMTDNDPETLSEWVNDYRGAIDYVLLDPSSGEGRKFDPVELLPYIDVLERKNSNVGIGVAGGLSAVQLSHLLPVIDRYPRVSVDAEGGLRDERTDKLDTRSAVNYARAMVRLYDRAQLHAGV
jgi:hypothetical protein